MKINTLHIDTADISRPDKLNRNKYLRNYSSRVPDTEKPHLPLHDSIIFHLVQCGGCGGGVCQLTQDSLAVCGVRKESEVSNSLTVFVFLIISWSLI